MLTARNVGLSYGPLWALDDVSLTVSPGSIVALLGPNGAGKSSLVSLFAGLRSPSCGNVSISGNGRCAERAGVVPQQVGLYPLLPVRHNLEFFGRLAGLRGDLRREIEQIADELGLSPLLDRNVANLSGGEQRLAHVAVGLLCNPGVLVLDEPTAALDVETRSLVLEATRRRALAGAAILYTTHYLPEVEILDATVAVLQTGRIVAQGAVSEIVSRHGGTFVEMTFDGAPPGRVERESVLADGAYRLRLEGGKAQLPRLIAELGEAAARMTSLQIVPPSLDSALIEITGRRYCEL